jgi:hypothetical protein
MSCMTVFYPESASKRAGAQTLTCRFYNGFHVAARAGKLLAGPAARRFFPVFIPDFEPLNQRANLYRLVKNFQPARARGGART